MNVILIASALVLAIFTAIILLLSWQLILDSALIDSEPTSESIDALYAAHMRKHEAEMAQRLRDFDAHSQPPYHSL